MESAQASSFEKTDSSNCTWDLGCINATCGTVGEGELCALTNSISQARCEPGLRCDLGVYCYGIVNQPSCAVATDCDWDATGSECRPVGGRCIFMPESGPCLPDFPYCADTAYCDGNDNCMPRAPLGASCSDDGVGAPVCASGLHCDAGTCAITCVADEDCPAGEGCDTIHYPSSCRPLSPLTCMQNTDCSQDLYCPRPDRHCTFLWSQGTCSADSSCTWIESTACVDTLLCQMYDYRWTDCSAKPGCTYTGCTSYGICSEHVGDPAACEFAYCTYTPDGWCVDPDDCTRLSTCNDFQHCNYDLALGSCIPTFDCTALTEADCNLHAADSCVVVPSNYCIPLTWGQACEPRQPPGSLCREDRDCASAWCSADSGGTKRCRIPPDRSEMRPYQQTWWILQLIFMFGAVVHLRPRRREWRRPG